MRTYNAHINQNAYNPETRVIKHKEEPQEVKVGQWWKWKMKDGEMVQREIVAVEPHVKCNPTHSVTDGFLQANARLIMCPSWPIEVGDRFEWQEGKSAIAKYSGEHGGFRLYDEETGKPLWPECHSLADLRSMRRLPRQDKPKGKRSDPNHVSQSDYHTGNDHVRDATEKVEAQPEIIFVADTEELFQKAGNVYPHECWSSRLWRLWIEDKKTLVLGNPEPVKAMQKRIAELDAKLHERPKVASQYQLKRTVKILDLGTKVYELTARIISLGNENADLRGERDQAIEELNQIRTLLRDKLVASLQARNPPSRKRGREMKKSNLHYILTVEEIKEKDPCKEGFEWVLANAVDGKIDRAAILEHRKDWEHWIIANGLCEPVVSSGGYRSTVTGGYQSTVSGGHRSTVSGGDRSTVTGGDQSTVSGGEESTVTGGDQSTVSGGDRSTVYGGHRSTVYGGDESTLSGGRLSTLSGGHRSTVSGGDLSTVSGGNRSTLSGGDRSTVSGGRLSIVSGGRLSTVSGGHRSVLMLLYWNDDHFEYQVAVVGKDGIKPETKYKLDDNNQFAEAADEQ